MQCTSLQPWCLLTPLVTSVILNAMTTLTLLGIRKTVILILNGTSQRYLHFITNNNSSPHLVTKCQPLYHTAYLSTSHMQPLQAPSYNKAYVLSQNTQMLAIMTRKHFRHHPTRYTFCHRILRCLQSYNKLQLEVIRKIAHFGDVLPSQFGTEERFVILYCQ